MYIVFLIIFVYFLLFNWSQPTGLNLSVRIHTFNAQVPIIFDVGNQFLRHFIQNRNFNNLAKLITVNTSYKFCTDFIKVLRYVSNKLCILLVVMYTVKVTDISLHVSMETYTEACVCVWGHIWSLPDGVSSLKLESYTQRNLLMTLQN